MTADQLQQIGAMLLGGVIATVFVRVADHVRENVFVNWRTIGRRDWS